MKKTLFTTLLLVALFIILVLFVLPYGLGFVAQHKYTQIIGVLSKSSTAQISLVNYQRGWFSSDATIQVSMQMPMQLMPQKTQPWIITQHIAHGPVFSMLSRTGEKQLALGQTLITTHANSPFGALDIVSRIKLNGELTGRVYAPKLSVRYTHPLLQENTTELQEVSGRFALSADLQKWKAQLHIPQMSIKTDMATQQLQEIHLFYQLQKSESGLFLGKRVGTVDSLTWNAGFIPSNTVKLEGIQITEQDLEKDKKIEAKVEAELKYVTLKNATYGPQRLQIVLRDVDVPTVLAWRKALRSFPDTATPFGQEYEKYRLLLLQLLSRGLHIQIEKLALATPWGMPSLVADIKIARQPTLNFIQVMAATQAMVDIHLPASFLMRLLEKTTMTLPLLPGAIQQANTTVPPNAVPPTPIEVAEQQITEWMHRKWLLPQGDGYALRVLFQNRQMTINNEPVMSMGVSPSIDSTVLPLPPSQEKGSVPATQQPVSPVRVRSDV